MSAHDQGAIAKSVRTYIGVFAMLLALTVLTVGVTRFHLAIPAAIAVALAIAIVKGSLVASFFMHLITERQPIYAALILTVVLLAALVMLPIFTTLDQIGTTEAFAR